MDFFKCDFQKVYECVRYHSHVLGKASKLRILDDSELELLSLIPLLDDGIITKIEFRRGADKYFNN